MMCYAACKPPSEYEYTGHKGMTRSAAINTLDVGFSSDHAKGPHSVPRNKFKLVYLNKCTCITS